MNPDHEAKNKNLTDIDWEKIHRSLEETGTSLEEIINGSPEKQKEILKARARELSGEIESVDPSMEYLEILEFSMASETYGIETEFIREVLSLKTFVTLPGTPPFVLGIINVRGKIVSIVDLKIFFNLPLRGIAELDIAIILHNERMEFGILADKILGSFTIPKEKIQPPLPTQKGISVEYIAGVTEDNVIILDGAKILNDEEIVVDQEDKKGSRY